MTQVRRNARTSRGKVNGRGMAPVAEKRIANHRRRALLWYGTGAGMLVGAIVGLLFGWLLLSGAIVPHGSEAIVSLGPIALHLVATMIGLALGGFVGATAVTAVAEA